MGRSGAGVAGVVDAAKQLPGTDLGAVGDAGRDRLQMGAVVADTVDPDDRDGQAAAVGAAVTARVPTIDPADIVDNTVGGGDEGAAGIGEDVGGGIVGVAVAIGDAAAAHGPRAGWPAGSW